MERQKPVWDLNTLYHSFSDEAFLRRLEDCDRDLSRLLEVLEDPSAPEPGRLAELLACYDDAALRLSTPETYFAMWGSVHPPDADYGRAEADLAALRRKRQTVYARLEAAMAALPEDEPAALQPELAPYGFLIQESRRLAAHRPGPEAGCLLQAMQETGGRGWAALRDRLDAAARVAFEDPEGLRLLSLSEARGLQASSDPALRRRAYEAELASYPPWAEPMAACLDGIKGEALAELPWKGYASVREEMLDVNRMRAETLDALHAALRDHLPALRDYLKVKARLLGHPGGLPWYELSAPVGDLDGAVPYDRARDLVTAALKDFSPAVGELADRAFRSRWIDALPTPGKRSGGICYDLPELRENRILVNYDGSPRAVRTLAHELGHAYHNRCLDGTPLCLRDVPTPICETASLFNETVLSETRLLEAGPRCLELLDAELSEAVQTVMDVYSRYLFEDEVFRRRRTHRLDAAELCGIMEQAQRSVFADALDPAALHPYMWMCKVHYYIPEFHYYSYPYYFGMLFSKGLYALYRQDREGFPSRYRALLADSCRGSLEEIAGTVGADITRRSFWDRALSGIDRLCEEFCAAAR